MAQKCWLWSMIVLVESAGVAGHPYRRRITMDGLDMRANGCGFSWVDGHETILHEMRGAFRSSRRPKCTAKACLVGFAAEHKTRNA